MFRSIIETAVDVPVALSPGDAQAAVMLMAAVVLLVALKNLLVGKRN